MATGVASSQFPHVGIGADGRTNPGPQTVPHSTDDCRALSGLFGIAVNVQDSVIEPVPPLITPPGCTVTSRSR
jgi:hypothetical protein